jgi:hypothetical protein
MMRPPYEFKLSPSFKCPSPKKRGTKREEKEKEAPF